MAIAVAGEQSAALNRLVDRFAERAEKLGVKVHRLAVLDEVAALAAELVKDGGPAAFAPAAGDGWCAVVAPVLDTAEPALRHHLTARGVTLVEANAEHPTTASVGVAVGISAALHGVAETGTMIVADSLTDRLVRMLAPKHILVLHLADLLPGLDEAGERLRVLANAGPDAPGRYVSFITGPSRTADIEMSLTVGAHGPAELHIAILGAAQR